MPALGGFTPTEVLAICAVFGILLWGLVQREF